MEIINGVEVEAGGLNDDRYCLEANNLSDIDDAATAFDNIKQVATNSTTGVSELATDAETVTGTATNRVTTPANIAAKMEAPGEIGGTTPATGNFTALDVSGQVQGDIVNNLNAFDFGERIMELSTDLIFLNVLCDDPSGGVSSYVDISTKGNHGTPVGSWISGDRIRQGRTWVLDPNGYDAYINIGNSNDLSFGDGSNDSPFTAFGVIEATNTQIQMILSKLDITSGSTLREYSLHLQANGTFRIDKYDESAGVHCNRITDAALSIGKHSLVIVDDGTGGAIAANGITIYVDGVAVASTATNNGAYVAMENTATDAWIGAYEGTGGAPTGFFGGDFGCLGIDDAEWAAMTAWRFHQLCLAFYSEDGSGL